MTTTIFTTISTSTITSGGGQYVIGMKQQVFPVRLRSEYEDEPISQRLVDAAHVDDLQLVSELLSQPSVDVNFAGTICLRSRKTEVVLNGESASEVRTEFEEFRTDVTALFLAAHNGNVALVRKLLVMISLLINSSNFKFNILSAKKSVLLIISFYHVFFI